MRGAFLAQGSRVVRARIPHRDWHRSLSVDTRAQLRHRRTSSASADYALPRLNRPTRSREKEREEQKRSWGLPSPLIRRNFEKRTPVVERRTQAYAGAGWGYFLILVFSRNALCCRVPEPFRSLVCSLTRNREYPEHAKQNPEQAFGFVMRTRLSVLCDPAKLSIAGSVLLAMPDQPEGLSGRPLPAVLALENSCAAQKKWCSHSAFHCVE